eukprot:7282247-Prymnesium_polylepis.1
MAAATSASPARARARAYPPMPLCAQAVAQIAALHSWTAEDALSPLGSAAARAPQPAVRRARPA